MIARIWHGFTTAASADRYEKLVEDEIFPAIAAKGVEGYRTIDLLRRQSGPDEVEFVTIMWFESWDAVKRFAGEEFERAYVPQRARDVLARFDEVSRHFEVRSRSTLAK